MQTLITASEAKTLVSQHDAEYINICEKIKQAASEGKHYVEVNNIVDFEISEKLEESGFDVDCVTDKPTIHKIWWGYD